MIPDELRYTAEHEWIRATDHGTAVFGITAFAQDALGDIVYVSLPATDTTVDAGQPCGEVESTKSVSDIYAPVSGRVVAVNGDLDANPEKVNADPYGEGWMVEIAPTDPAQLEGLLTPGEYRAITERT